MEILTAEHKQAVLDGIANLQGLDEEFGRAKAAGFDLSAQEAKRTKVLASLLAIKRAYDIE